MDLTHATLPVTHISTAGGGGGTGLPPGWVSVLDPAFGAVGNLTALDTPAFLLARDTGANVLIPAGTAAAKNQFLVEALDIQPLPGQTFKQDGYKNLALGGTGTPLDHHTALYNVSATGFVFKLGGNSALLDGIIIQQHPSYLYTDSIATLQADTGGKKGHFYVGSVDNVNLAWHNQIRNCVSIQAYMAYCIEGLGSQGGCNNTKLLFNEAYNAANSAYYIDMATPAGDLMMSHNRNNGSGYGIRIKRCDTSKIYAHHSAAVRWSHIWYEASLGDITQVDLVGGTFEGLTGTANEHIVIGNSTYKVMHCNLTNIETLPKTDGNIGNITIGANCRNVSIANSNLYLARVIDNGKYTALTNNMIRGRADSAAGNAAGIGLDIGATALDCTYNGLHVNKFTTGCNFNNSGNGFHSLVGNNFRDNATPTAGPFYQCRASANIGLADM